MKRKILGAAAALITAAAATITASAEYYIGTQQDGNTVKVEIIANGATLPAIEFTVEMPENAEISNIEIFNDALFNEDNGIFAWAGAEAPADGTVMLSATFTVEDGYVGEFAVVPAEGFENDMLITLTAEIVGEDGVSDNETDNKDDTTDDETSTPDDTTTPSEDSDTPSTDNNPTDDTVPDENIPSDDTTAGSDNPHTGITLAFAPIILTGAALIVSTKKR